jgi:hypothetical protein
VKIQKNLKEFKELDLTITITFYIQNLLIPSILGIENTFFRLLGSKWLISLQPLGRFP